MCLREHVLLCETNGIVKKLSMEGETPSSILSIRSLYER